MANLAHTQEEHLSIADFKEEVDYIRRKLNWAGNEARLDTMWIMLRVMMQYLETHEIERITKIINDMRKEGIIIHFRLEMVTDTNSPNKQQVM